MLIITSVISASAAQLDTEVSAFPTKAADNTVTAVTFTDGSTQSYTGMADAGDLDGDGVVTILDAACVQKYAVDKTSGIGRAGQKC